MVKKLYIPLVILLVCTFVVVGCSSSTPTTTAPVTTTPATTAPATTSPAATTPVTSTPATTPTPTPTPTPIPTPIPPPTLPVPLSSFQKGVTFGAWRAGTYTTPQADVSFQNLANTGANWTEVIVAGYQDTVTSSAIDRTSVRTNTDAGLTRAIQRAHQKGIKVLLKPQIDFSNDPTHWRGQIGTAFTSESQWQAWFQAYQEFITHYASLAQQSGVEIFCIGTELVGASSRENDWRQVIREVRQRFQGQLVYASLPKHALQDGDLERIAWWDALDYIGVDVYYPLTSKNDPTVDELKTAWTSRGYVAQLDNISRRFGKPVIFTEFGYRSLVLLR